MMLTHNIIYIKVLYETHTSIYFMGSNIRSFQFNSELYWEINLNDVK